MARARGRDSHAGGKMLNYSIRGPLAPSISPEFYSCIGQGASSSLYPKFIQVLTFSIQILVQEFGLWDIRVRVQSSDSVFMPGVIKARYHVTKSENGSSIYFKGAKGQCTKGYLQISP
jgi:hypothetical protein